jgi:hypothetical protein
VCGIFIKIYMLLSQDGKKRGEDLEWKISSMEIGISDGSVIDLFIAKHSYI